MSDSIIESLRADIKVAEEQLLELDKMIQIAQKAGEDVTALKAKYMNVKSKIDRWKKALA